jgi:hypothetical protein
MMVVCSRGGIIKPYVNHCKGVHEAMSVKRVFISNTAHIGATGECPPCLLFRPLDVWLSS